MKKARCLEECFFAPPQSFGEGSLAITGSEARHIAVVLRRRPGDAVCVLDGRGGRYSVELTECSPEMIRGRIIEKQEFSPRTPEIWLAAGIIRAARMDLLVEKCTEVGVGTIFPVFTKRSLSSKGVSDSRLARWQRISVGAMTQCARVFLPEVRKPVSLEELFGVIGTDATVLLAHPSGKSMHLLNENDLSRARVVACVGPEGDFTAAEIEFLIRHDAIPVSLGEVVLRAETAAVVVLDRLNFLLERRGSAAPTSCEIRS
ncbi:MAG: 16S rRNA (uracil(1498)-N(3))-methyltransferase [Candidatus Eisenbacteria bacterium]|nr:16S rRNA (uracil(1498)-N(3))-methyltransferase [Candidatus Eisenbacteria bacterium]